MLPSFTLVIELGNLSLQTIFICMISKLLLINTIYLVVLILLFLDFWQFMTLEVESKEDPNSRAMSNQPSVLISLLPGWFWSLRVSHFWIWPLLSLLFNLVSLIMHTYILLLLLFFLKLLVKSPFGL